MNKIVGVDRLAKLDCIIAGEWEGERERGRGGIEKEGERGRGKGGGSGGMIRLHLLFFALLQFTLLHFSSFSIFWLWQIRLCVSVCLQCMYCIFEFLYAYWC